MAKKTMPNEPEEFPVRPAQPEISQQQDPGEPQIPHENNDIIPPEILPLPDDLPPEGPQQEPDTQQQS